MKTIFTTLLLAITIVSFAQKKDIEKDTIKLDEVLVSATRASKKDPFTKSKLSKKQLEKQNLGQDVPILLDALPNVVTTTDTGIGIGYTGIRVRGSDATRVNVTINGIPYNDSESQGTYWVDLPDFASSVESIQLQRGVGTSTNGAGAFGASLSLETEGLSDKVSVELSTSYGSFNTFKKNIKANSGIIKNHYNVLGRIATIKSDGYIDRASSDLQSFYVEGNYFNDKTSVKALMFGGREITYQSWYGIDKETLINDRTFNPAGAVYDSNGDIRGFYDNQVDDYKQDHYQLHFAHQFNDYLTVNLAFHYTYGRGFYEQYKQGEDFADYGFTPFIQNGQIINKTDLVRRKWLDNDFYGTTFSVKYKKETTKIVFGGAYNNYVGDHFGKVIWTPYNNISLKGKFYDNTGEKSDFNVFTKVSKTFNKWVLFADLQFRMVDYAINGVDDNGTDLELQDDLNFFNPKAGITYTYNKKNDLYFSFARANKEPKRGDYIDGDNPKPEQLNDFEFGWRHNTKKATFNTNMYYMLYKDQLVLTGALNDVGSPIANNIGESYRFGLELDAQIKIGNQFIWSPNMAISQNKNIDKYDNKDGELIRLGETNLSYSPNFVASNILTYKPNANFSTSLIAKYISNQYMSNTENNLSKLQGYSVTNINFQYKLQPRKYIKEVVFTALLNNVFNAKYVSNGYFYGYDDTWSVPNQTTTIYGSGYYPQAGFNFLTGITLKF
ncbi:MAG TPA: TonB-dependent receptor [Flavobacteriaceae bacterium]|nr:TonB-dependent receptor [Flavobacteriaceae bacterium]